jgi:uncharacterized protein YpiB (UPF0302 family)
MASNLPPGCRESDIPGSRPEDVAWDKLVEGFYNSLTEEEIATIDCSGTNSLIEKAIKFGMEKQRQDDELSSKEADFYCAEYLRKELLRVIEEAFDQEPKEVFLD